MGKPPVCKTGLGGCRGAAVHGPPRRVRLRHQLQLQGVDVRARRRGVAAGVGRGLAIAPARVFAHCPPRQICFRFSLSRLNWGISKSIHGSVDCSVLWAASLPLAGEGVPLRRGSGRGGRSPGGASATCSSRSRTGRPTSSSPTPAPTRSTCRRWSWTSPPLLRCTTTPATSLWCAPTYTLVCIYMRTLTSARAW